MAVKCNACPNLVFERIEDYRAHQKTKWHAFNTEQRLMGRCTLTEEQYLEKVGGSGDAAAGKKEASPGAKKEQAAGGGGGNGGAAPASPPGMATVVVIFEHAGEKWSHRFVVAKGTTVLDLQRSMVRKESPPEDLLSFNLKKGMIRTPYFETLDGDETFQFNYCGYEEGQKLFEKDKARKEREEEQIQQRREEEQRQKEERQRKEEEEQRRRKEEDLAKKKREEEERSRKEEEEKNKLEEERRLAQEEEDKKKLEEEQRRVREEEDKRKKLEEERRRAEEEQKRKLEEDRRRAQEEEEKRKLEEERRRAQEEQQQREAELAAQRQRAEEAERKRQADKEVSRSVAAEEELRQVERQSVKEDSKPLSGDGAEVEVVVYIERSLDIKTVMRLRLGDSIWAVKERLAKDDPTGEASASDFGLVEPIFGQELADAERISVGLTELDVYVRK